MTKSDIRNLMRTRRREVDPEEREEASAAVCDAVWARADVQAAVAAKRPFAVYLANDDEIDLAPLVERLWAADVTVAVPYWHAESGTYRLAIYTNASTLIEGFHGIMEPAETYDIAPSDIGVWIVPGLAFAPQDVETFDTLALSRRLRPDLPSHKLSYLIGALDIDGVNSHDALDDALACAGVFFSFIKEAMAKQNSRGLPGDFFGIMYAHETGHDES